MSGANRQSYCMLNDDDADDDEPYEYVLKCGQKPVKRHLSRCQTHSSTYFRSLFRIQLPIYSYHSSQPSLER